MEIIRGPSLTSCLDIIILILNAIRIPTLNILIVAILLLLLQICVFRLFVLAINPQLYFIVILFSGNLIIESFVIISLINRF